MAQLVEYETLSPSLSLSISDRLLYLKRLSQEIKDYESTLLDALTSDLRKSAYEGYMTEIYPTLSEINLYIRNLHKWLKRKRCKGFRLLLGARAYIEPQPMGRVLIFAPWNYPLLLLLVPLINAFSAGNSVLLVPSSRAMATARVIKSLVEKVFEPNMVQMLEPEQYTESELLEPQYDLIMYTGGETFARRVAAKAGERLTPVILELGGKCPLVITDGADMRLAARRVAWGKLLNGGQSCVAPDYALVSEHLMGVFIAQLEHEFEHQLKEFAPSGDGMVPVVNLANLDRLVGWLEGETVIYGGGYNRETLRMQPTIVIPSSDNSPLWHNEILGPILVLRPVRSVPEIISRINGLPPSLVVYYFGNRRESRTIIRRTKSGAVCVNDVVIQMCHPHLPMGGVGRSGMGRYHGKEGLYAFSNMRAMLWTTRFEMSPRYSMTSSLQRLKRYLRLA